MAQSKGNQTTNPDLSILYRTVLLTYFQGVFHGVFFICFPIAVSKNLEILEVLVSCNDIWQD